MKITYNDKNLPVYETEDAADELIFDLLNLNSLNFSMKMGRDSSYNEMEKKRLLAEETANRIKKNLLTLR